MRCVHSLKERILTNYKHSEYCCTKIWPVKKKTNMMISYFSDTIMAAKSAEGTQTIENEETPGDCSGK